jgi:hypothetical protein
MAPAFSQVSSASQSGCSHTAQDSGPVIYLLLCEHGPGDAATLLAKAMTTLWCLRTASWLSQRTHARRLLRAVLQDRA